LLLPLLPMLGLLACLLSLPGSSRAQTPQTPARPMGSPHNPAAPQKLYSIAGTVTNILTGETVAHASISLVDEATGETMQTMESGPDGQFALEPVAAGKYALRAARRGYIAAFFDEHDEYSSAIVTGEGQDTEHIPFRLNPGAMAYGTITDDTGEPVQNAHIMLIRRTRTGGLGEHLAAEISGQTDDQGNFEFWNLQPGTYFLAVQATPWFALHPVTSISNSADNAAGSAERRNAAAALDVAYPVTYYDAQTDQASATPVTLRSGDHVALNVMLHAVPAVHLLVRGADLRGNNFNMMPHLSQSVMGQEAETSVEMHPGPPGSGLMEFAGVPPGHYSVSQGDPPRTVEIDANGGSMEVNPAQGEPAAKVTLKVHMADNSPLPERLGLTLHPQNEGGRDRQGPVIAASQNSTGSLTGAWTGNLRPGSWTVLPFAANQALAVVSVEGAGGARQESRIQVADKPLTLSIALAKGAAQVTGFAFKEDKGVPGVMIVLVPRNPEANWALFRRDQSDSDGSFRLRNVVPGQYTVVAIEEGWDLDWAKPEVISRYLPKGIPVTVPAASGKLLELDKPVPVQHP
jgi:hypothetical protein